MLDKNPETVKIVFKNFPLRMHKQAIPAAIAAMAAKKQGKFWEFHDLLFTKKQFSPQGYLDYAKELNLDISQFQKDMTAPEIQQFVARDMKEGQEVGVRGTPTLFVGGRRVKSRSIPAIQELIDKALADSKESTKK